jgi:RNA polymerase sigma-70 factor (ECF subfamily)
MQYVRASDPRTDQELVKTAQNGCSTAFEILVERYHFRLEAYFRRRTGDASVALDLTQETFLIAYRMLHQISLDRPFAAWLYRVARNNLLHEWRRSRLQPHLAIDTPAMIEDLMILAHDEATRCDEREYIRHVLNQLNPALREALMLTIYGFLSQEVASLLRISPAAARQRIKRAKDEFRCCYTSLAYEQGARTPAS